MPELLFGRDLETLESIEIDITGRDEEREEVLLDFEFGPVVNKPDGSFEYYGWTPNAYSSMDPIYPGSGRKQTKKTWKDMTSTEKQVATIMVAKRNRALRLRTGVCNPDRSRLAELGPSRRSPEPATAPAISGHEASSGVQQPPPVALLFPGQGSQYVGMLGGLEEIEEVQDMLRKANEILGYDLLAMCLEGPEELLAETRYCQPAMFVGGLAAVAKLRAERGEVASNPRCVAGLSLGEYTALCVAGVFSFEDGLRLVKLRGEAMQDAASIGKQAMLSVVGLEREVVQELCVKARKTTSADAVCQIANDLFPKGFSCAGTEKAIENLKDLADKKNALQVKMLKASGGFHTVLMTPAKARLSKALKEMLPRMRPPTCQVYANFTAEPLEPGTDPEIIVDLLTEQLVNPVLWCPTIEGMISSGIREFYECGPQKQIKAMMKRINSDAWAKTVNIQV